MTPMLSTYFTDGQFPWAVLFLSSLKRAEGADCRVLLNSRGLNAYQIWHLEKMHPNCKVVNRSYDFGAYKAITGLCMNTLLEQKLITERLRVTNATRCWKLIHDYAKINSIASAFERACIEGFDSLIYFDIDTYFRSSFIGMLNGGCMMRRFDDLEEVEYNRAVTDMIVLDCCDNTAVTTFLNLWKYYIELVKLVHRPMHFHRSTCYRASTTVPILWKDIPAAFGLSGHLSEDHVLWTGGSITAYRTDVLNYFEKDFYLQH